MDLTEGGRFGADEVLAVDFDEAVVRLRIPKDDPKRKLLRPWTDLERRTFGRLDLPPIGGADCPRFLERVQGGRAWVRTGGPGEERSLEAGDELCSGWIVDELRDGSGERRGLLTLRKGERLLRIAEVFP